MPSATLGMKNSLTMFLTAGARGDRSPQTI